MKSLAERTAIQQAYLDGKAVQFFSRLEEKWINLVGADGDFAWHLHDYRIKPAEPVKLYQALCKAGRGYYVSSYLYIDEAAVRKELPNDFIRLLVENPITAVNTEKERKMEKILAINDYEGKDGYSGVEGFEVVTDKQSIKLFIDNDQSCCEKWGYFWCNEDPQIFIGSELRGVTVTDDALNEGQMKANDLNPNDKYFEGGIMFVNLDTSAGVLQFVAYNEHNGYYGHAAKVVSTQLTREERL